MTPGLLPPQVQKLYQQQLNSLPDTVTGRYQNTELGQVWLLEAGDPQAPVLMALHGLQTPAPFLMEMLLPLTEHYRIICPDIPGQAGHSGLVAPLPVQQGYAYWLGKLMDALELPACAMLGMSFGGAILLDAASLMPERISAASLWVPAGFFRPVWRPIKSLLLPVLSFKLNSDQPHFDRMMDPLLGQNWPELKAYYYAVQEAGLPLVLIPPGPFGPEQLQSLQAPVQLVVAEQDIYFAPDKLIKLAQYALPELADLLRLDDLHVPSPEHRALMAQRLGAFLHRHTAGV
ncbi:alpha/beta fold hydrolase [Pontibacter sp. JAM-7]|uniref:alpha/beta fold hydrolase n=1 Tax=Pontibacter sp. JAM-7 TaxID=3366581 RepID=UPI003AF6637B